MNNELADEKRILLILLGLYSHRFRRTNPG